MNEEDRPEDLPEDPDDPAVRTVHAGLTTLSEVVRQERVPEALDSLVTGRILGLLEGEEVARRTGEARRPPPAPESFAPVEEKFYRTGQDLPRVREPAPDIPPPPPPLPTPPAPPHVRRSAWPLVAGLFLGLGLAAAGLAMAPDLVDRLAGGMASDEPLPASVGDSVTLTVLALEPGEAASARRAVRPGGASPTGTRVFFRFGTTRAGSIYLLQRDPVGRWACLFPESGQHPANAPAGDRELTREGKLLGTQLDEPGAWSFLAMLGPDESTPAPCRPSLSRRVLDATPGWEASTVTMTVGGGGPGAP
ncbi:DUF4384 domain-containing protein [Myxococcota bacterium]|nr:DUF4384 domain-containing protein [Myxococcota bacterium]